MFDVKMNVDKEHKPILVIGVAILIALVVFIVIRISAPMQPDALQQELVRITAEYRSAPGGASHDLGLSNALVVISQTWSNRISGVRDAKRDLECGLLVFKGYDRLDTTCQKYVGLLKNHGILYEPVTTPVSNTWNLAYVYGYNSTVKAALVERGDADLCVKLLSQCAPGPPSGLDPKLWSGGYSIGDHNLFFMPWYFSETSNNSIQATPDGAPNG